MPNSRQTNTRTDPWLRTTVDAVVRHRERDFVDLDLHAPGLAKSSGRLYQSKSLANSPDSPLLEALERYAPGEHLRVYIYRLASAQGHFSYHVHERWADENNPWRDLDLYEDDVVSGTVRTAIIHEGQLKAWLVQLDAGKPFPMNAEAGLQPDIEVYLPLHELPWADGSTTEVNKGEKRLVLTRGDRVLLLVTELAEPPQHPKASISRLIHQMDATSVSKMEGEIPVGNSNPLATSQNTARTLPTTALLTGYVIWLVDDDAHQMQHLAQRLEANGAKTKSFLVEPGLWEPRCTQMAHALQESVLVAPISGNRAPDLVLVDLHLLQQAKGGMQLIRRWHELASTTGKTVLRCALLSNLIPPTQAWPDCCATLLRPLQLGTLLAVLAGETIWQGSDATGLIIKQAAQSQVKPWLEQLRKDCQADFATLLAAHGSSDLRILSSAGQSPFAANALNSAMENSELRLLLSGHLQVLALRPQDHNPTLKHRANGHAIWFGLQNDQNEGKGADWILGLGTPEAIPANERHWLARFATQALNSMRQADAMHDLGDLLSKGMRFDALGHEWMHRQHVFTTMLEKLSNWQQQLSGEANSIETLLSLLESNLSDWQLAADELQQTADTILGIQRGRHTPLDLPKLLKMLYPLAKKSCDARDVALHWPQHTPPLALDLPASVVSVPLLNLIDNAAKHHVKLENNWVQLQIDMPTNGPYAGNLLLSVIDNSFGLGAAQQATLFQLMRSTARSEENHGIGLWLARQVAQKVGGDIKLAWSWRGTGSKFDLVLPMPLENNNEREK